MLGAGQGRRRVMWRRATSHGLWLLWTLLELCSDLKLDAARAQA